MRWPYFFGPLVPGALAPVNAEDDMTEPVGVRKCRLYTRSYAAAINALTERVAALEQGGGGAADTKVFPQTVDTSFLNHYTLTVGAGYVPETIDMVFRGNTHSVFHLVRANEDYYEQTGVFVDQNGNTFVVYNGTGDTTKVYIEQETAMVNAGTPVYAVVSAKKIS